MKKFIAKCVLLFCLVYAIQFAVTQIVPTELPEEIAQMQKGLNTNKDVLYLGDSVLFTGGVIPQRLDSKLADASVEMVAHPANSPIVYQDYCLYLSRKPRNPKLIIVPISMRYFSPDWEWDPNKQFMEERLHFRYAHTPVYPLLRFLIGFKVFKIYPRTVDTYHAMRYTYNGLDLGPISDYHGAAYEQYSDDWMRKKIQISYVNRLEQDDEILRAVERIADRCTFSNVLFYITPLSYETGERFLGDTFSSQIDENVTVVINTLKKKQAHILDMSHDLPEKSFEWDLGLYMGDHLKEDGQEAVASRLAEYISDNHLLAPK